MNCGGYYFDYSQIDDGDYGSYVFRRVVSALSSSGGLCCFNDGDIPRRQAKEILSYCERQFPVTAVQRPSPLSDSSSDFPGGLYMVGMWTDTPKSFDVLHDAFNKADVQGYLGGFVLSEAMGQSDYAQFLSSTLCLPPNIILCDGSKGGNNKYMV